MLPRRMSSKFFWRIISTLFKSYFRNEIPLRAAGISYFLFFSLIPILTTFLSIGVALSSWWIAPEHVLPHLTRWLLPDAIHEVQYYFQEFSAHIEVVSIASFVVASWLLVKIVFFFEKTLNQVWKYHPKHSFFQILRKGLLGFLFMGITILIGVTALGFGFERILIDVMITWLLFLGFNLIVPNRKIYWKWAIPGSLINGTIWYMTKLAFTSYVHHLAKPHQIYAILGILPLFFLWMYFSVVNLLFSACLNYAIFHHFTQSESAS